MTAGASFTLCTRSHGTKHMQPPPYKGTRSTTAAYAHEAVHELRTHLSSRFHAKGRNVSEMYPTLRSVATARSCDMELRRATKARSAATSSLSEDMVAMVRCDSQQRSALAQLQQVWS